MTYQAKHKYHAIATEVDNQKFTSKLEASYFKYLQLLVKAGEVVFFLRQVPFHLKCGAKYVCDFQVFYTDGRIEFIDPKGVLTQEFSLKKKMVECEYPVVIKTVGKGDF
jgi:hypothetical protein